MTKKIAPFGSWLSPITADAIVAKSIRFGEVRTDGNTIYWLEDRPTEKGRGVVVRKAENDAEPVDFTPPYTRGQFNVRTRVYEYGGGAWLVDGGDVYFTNVSDGRLYRQKGNHDPVALTPESPVKGKPTLDYADGRIDPHRDRWIGIIEDWSGVLHSDRAQQFPEHRIVAIDLRPQSPSPAMTLVEGSDFYASPRLSPSGHELAWLEWNHPHMPWQSTSLCMAKLNEAGQPIGTPIEVAGGLGTSVCQPEWSPDGNELWFVSDSEGWWQLFRYELSNKEVKPVLSSTMEVEFGRPQWKLGKSTYAFLKNGAKVVATYIHQGLANLAVIDTASGKLEDLIVQYADDHGKQVGYTWFDSLSADTKGHVAFVAGGAKTAASIVVFDLRSRKPLLLRKASPLADDPDIKSTLTTLEPKTFSSVEGVESHGFYYAPFNPDFTGPPGDKPPLIVMCHGGPTAQAPPTLNFRIQYWTSRGVAVLDVNYRGSSGFGRSYRNSLMENWGVVDVEDCVNGAKWLAKNDLVDPNRLVITGSSAGGFTTLACLTFRSDFKAGASYYNIGDLEELTKHTHKFESHYLDWLVGPYPEQHQRYKERSPINHTERISQPIIFFQGGKDQVVPKTQAEAMVKALKSKGLPVGYFLFEGEAHGFHEDENIRRAIEAEHYFLSSLIFQSAPEASGVEFTLIFRSSSSAD